MLAPQLLLQQDAQLVEHFDSRAGGWRFDTWGGPVMYLELMYDVQPGIAS